MKRAWVEEKIKEQYERRSAIVAEARGILVNSGLFTEEEAGELCRAANTKYPALPLIYAHSAYLDDAKRLAVLRSAENKLEKCTRYGHDFARLLDSEPMYFDGDIIITDPCYVCKGDDWELSGYGREMEKLGIKTYMTRDTIYGDWGCTVVESKTRKKLGNFCADAGLVSVLLLDEVLKYNPGFDYHKTRDWTTTWIKDFNGTVQFVVKPCRGTDTNADIADFDAWDYEVSVVGHGEDKKTGKKIDFYSKQTSI